MLAVEVDEGQHKAKSYHEDVDARYNDLAMVFGGQWVFIRFNPDSHADADGKVPWDSLRTRTTTMRTCHRKRMLTTASSGHADVQG